MTYLDEFLENLGECLYIQRAASIQTATEKAVRQTTPGSKRK
jgi:hypothetical protein